MRDDYKARGGRPLPDGGRSDRKKFQIHPAITLGAKIEVEMTQDGTPSQNCEQTLTMSGDPTGGTFKIRYRGKLTIALDFDATAGDIESAIEALENVGAGNVSVTGGPIDTDPVVIEFVGDLALQEIEELEVWFGKLEEGTLNLPKGEFGWVARLKGDLGAEEISYEVVYVYNRFSDVDADLALKCLYSDTGEGDELIQVECVEE